MKKSFKIILSALTIGVFIFFATAIRVQVRQTSATGTIVYQEQHIVTSNPQGIVNLVIGNGYKVLDYNLKS